MRESWTSRTVHHVQMSTIQIELPAELLELSGSGEGASQAARNLIALELFREQRITLGKAAELAGVSVEQFMDFSASRGVSLHYEISDLEADHSTAKLLGL